VADVPTGYPNKRARTRRALVRGAMQVMGETGSIAPTTTAVTAAAGVSNGTFYNYVADTSELVGLVADDLAQVFELGQENLQRLSGDPAARVALGILQLLELPRTDPVYARAFLVAMASDTAFRTRIRSLVAGEVGRGIEHGVFRAASVDVLTNALLGATLQTLRSALLGEVDTDGEAVVDVCLRLLGVDDVRGVTERGLAAQAAAEV
jgi:AcrR family transcriptional regulator